MNEIQRRFPDLIENKVKRRFPNFVEMPPSEWVENTFATKDELMEVEWIKRHIQQPYFVQFLLGEKSLTHSAANYTHKLILETKKKSNQYTFVGLLWLYNPIDLPYMKGVDGQGSKKNIEQSAKVTFT